MIDLKKKYRTRSGLDVVIYAIYPNQENSVIGAYVDNGWHPASWTLEGRYGFGVQLDLVEVLPYEDFKIDDKVLVWNEGEAKRCRHFAGVSKYGQPLSWIHGGTSWTTNETVAWEHCIKADEQ